MSLVLDAVIRSSLVLAIGLAAVWLLQKAAGGAAPLGAGRRARAGGRAAGDQPDRSRAADPGDQLGAEEICAEADGRDERRR